MSNDVRDRKGNSLSPEPWALIPIFPRPSIQPLGRHHSRPVDNPQSTRRPGPAAGAMDGASLDVLDATDDLDLLDDLHVHGWCRICKAGDPPLGSAYIALCGRRALRRANYAPGEIPAGACAACVDAWEAHWPDAHGLMDGLGTGGRR